MNRKPLPRDHRGWQVAPAPDGRGAPDPPTAKPPHRSRGFIWFVVALLAFNLGAVFLFPSHGQERVKVPFSPYFLSKLQSGRVESIASKGDTIQGTFKSSVRYPSTDTTAKPTTLFATQVPSFWNNAQLTALLKSETVDHPGQFAAGLAAARLRPGAADRRVVCHVCPPGGQERRWDGRVGELRSLQGATDRSGDDHGHVR